ncbi:hypothetical protein [Streptomyces zagrosensis]|uniref:Uncharacterized protein n=1 Tax=Streptomyces zagrosensis TaxID=1042984 RepID=A0A7W9Q6Z2_9ACTN|nr:hypothetical protein [Streptomyces zagrosensis]MBB5934686.1 hypothetical protein [Streptomyces zagrosensis]
MTSFPFELVRTGSTNQFVLRKQVFSWSGDVGGLGTFEMKYPQEPTDVVQSRVVASATRNGTHIAAYSAAQHNGRPTLTDVEFTFAGDPAKLSRRSGGLTRKARTLHITVAGREYLYAQTGGKRKHTLTRDRASVQMTRSTWKNPRTIRGVANGTVDATDIGIALLLEGVYTRDLSWPGAFLYSIGRFMNGI